MIRLAHTNAVRRGSALATALVMFAALMVLTLTLFKTAFGSIKRTQASQSDRRAFQLAEAGIQEAFAALRTGRTGAVATAVQPAYFGGGYLWVEATDLGSDRTRLVSTALSGAGREALEVVVEVSGPNAPLFVATLNSKDTLILNQGVVIDSFDSSLGDYASQVVNTVNGFPYALDNGDARSNQDIILNADATLIGDAIPGPTYGVTYNNNSYVHGDDTPATSPFNFPPITFPVYPPSGAYALGNASTDTIGPGNFDYDSFSIAKDAALTVVGPAQIVVDDFTGGKDALLYIDATAGPVTFFVEGNYAHTSGFEALPVAGSEMAVAFMVEGSNDIVFPSLTDIRGAYYAPNANILFSNGNECWGAFAGNQIVMSNDMRFHFDEDLMRHWEEDTGNNSDPVQILSWSTTEVLPESLRGDRRDPELVLGVSASSSPSPSGAWQP